eukprot:scaffold9109_cov48-Phaeocystis_antarctica.AAC.5
MTQYPATDLVHFSDVARCFPFARIVAFRTSWWPPAPRGRPIKGNQSCRHRPDETCQAIVRARWPPPPLSDPPRLPPVAADIASAGSEAGVKLVRVRVRALVL